jgi:hypothetical protein
MSGDEPRGDRPSVRAALLRADTLAQVTAGDKKIYPARMQVYVGGQSRQAEEAIHAPVLDCFLRSQ